MRKSDAILKADTAFASQMNTFRLNIGTYANLLGVTIAQVAAQSADAAYFSYLLQGQEVLQKAGQQWTTWKNLARAGGTPPITGLPGVVNLPTTVAAVALGIEVRFRALVQSIKTNANYNEAIGKALGIEGAEHVGPDLATVQPAIEVFIAGNHVHVKWGWGGYGGFLDLCEIQVDRGDGKGFSLLTYDTTPGYVDTQPFPATPAKWSYRAIYHVGDDQVGQWSNPVSLTVGQ